jgi:PAS domain S-box-containing protein
MYRFDPSSISDFRKWLEEAGNGVVVVDQRGTILVFNRMARRLLGKPSSSLVGRFMRDVFPNSWHDLEQILRTGRPQIAKRVEFENGTIIANRTPIMENGRPVGVLSIFQDIGEYERILTQLEAYKQLNEEMNVIINSSYDGLWICDHEGKVVRVNRASEKMSGVRQEDVLGKRIEDLVRDGIFDKSVTPEVLKHRTTVTLIQKVQDGRQVLVTGNPVTDADGNIRLVVVNARDISELNRLQAELEQSRQLNYQYSSELKHLHRYHHLHAKVIFRSTIMKRVFETAMRVARVDSNVLISGESGVGKGLFAELIHQASGQSKASLIHINCGAIPECLIEAELFGYEKGAFTGARTDGKPGYFEMADGGTLLLDEIGELPLGVQVKLLQFLEENRIMRIGSTKARKISTRIIAATNRKLESMVREGTFREDLFFRLNVVPIKIPPLRDRREDIPPLVYYFLKQFNEKCHTHKVLTAGAIDILRSYPFPGNIRELANLIEQLVVLTPHDQIGPGDLPAAIRLPESDTCLLEQQNEWDLSKIVRDVEKRIILRALKQCGSQRKAARLLNINHSTLSRKIRRYGAGSVAMMHRVD